MQPAVTEPVDFGDPAELFQIRGHLHTLISLRLLEPDDHRFFLLLQKAIARAPDFFRHAPVVIDVGHVADRPPFNLAEFGRRLRQQQLVPVGVQNGSEAWNQMAVNAGFAVVPASRSSSAPVHELERNTPPAAGPTPTPVPDPKPTAAPTPAPAQIAAPATEARAERAGADAKVVTEPVRAGQQIYARNGDLVVLAPVSPGAEILADGHVHIYSSLKGRAHAGVSGNEGARIFCHDMRAQLISIAGIYLVNEEIDERFLGQRVQIRCMNETIVMEPLP